jgi:hypothetical protein
MRIILIICLLLAGKSYAQDTTGTISGRIINNREEAIKGAEVSVYNHLGIRAFATTDNNGRFITNKIDTGMYEVNVRYRAYKRSIITKVPVKAGGNSDMLVKIFAQSSSWDTVSTYNPYNIVEVRPYSPLAPAKPKKVVPKKVKK